MDVFLSYAREDRDRAREVATALEHSGWSVWWDRKIITGETFDQTIERELESAKSVVVLWSNASIASEWVKNEAAAAAERQILVPALIEDVRIPLEFRRRQTANLIDWDGDSSNEGFQALREGVASRVGTATPPRVPPPPRSRHVIRLPRWAPIAAAAVIVVAGMAAYLVWSTRPVDSRSISAPGEIATGGEPQPARISDSSPGAAKVAQPRVVTANGGNSVDHPAPLAFGAMHKVTLDQNEEYFFQLPAPASAVKIIEDARFPKNERGNLQTQLSLLDADGAVVEANVIFLNEIDLGFRKTASYSTKQPSRWGFKLVNSSRTAADIWLTVLPEGQNQFLPFFGTVVPRPWSAGKDATGTLDQNEDVYYLVRLPRGDNRVVLDFANAKREQRNLQGYLAVLDADGGGQTQVIFLNQIDVSYRTVGAVTVKADGPLILRLQNSSAPVTYNLRIPDAR